MRPPGEGGAPTLGQVGEAGVLRRVFAALGRGREQSADGDGVLVGPGDDTALLAVRGGAVLATTDTVVRGQDWRDDWSTPQDVGVKVVTQNLADLAAMGGVGTALLVALLADPDTPVAWATGLTEGMARAAGRSGVPVVGGDLSSAGAGTLAVAVTALGELGPGVQRPVLRSGAAPGQVLAVSGPLGRSGAGWELLQQHGGEGVQALEQEAGQAAARCVREVLEHHRRPMTDLTQGPRAARGGASAMMDVSDGLVRDGDRIARASGVRLELDPDAVGALAARLAPAVGEVSALSHVLAGGEEHELLATFPGAPPTGWTVLGRTAPAGADGPGVWLDGRQLDPATGGWDHFGG